MKMTDFQKSLYCFFIGMFISVLTAWWWFGSGYYPKAMPAGRFLVLNILHALIGAATVTCGLAAIIAKIIELDKKKK